MNYLCKENATKLFSKLFTVYEIATTIDFPSIAVLVLVRQLKNYIYMYNLPVTYSIIT